MSYLDAPRLHFSGWFQADVSTINNDVRTFQNASFVPKYQQLNQNGSWNVAPQTSIHLRSRVMHGIRHFEVPSARFL